MKFIGQFIQDFIARFRNDVYLEDLTEPAQDHVVGIDADGKLYKQDVSTGDITGVTITTDSGGGSKAEDTSGSADFSILGSSGVNVTNSGTTITAVSVPGEIDHDSLLNFVAAEHYRWDTDISSTATIHTNNIIDLHGAGVNGSASQLLTDDGDGTVTSQSEAQIVTQGGLSKFLKNTTANNFLNNVASSSAFNLYEDVVFYDPSNGNKTNRGMLVSLIKGLNANYTSGTLEQIAGSFNCTDPFSDNTGATVNQTALFATVTGNSSGTTTGTGLSVSVASSDINDGITIATTDGSASTGHDIKISSSVDTDDFFGIRTFGSGETEITTVDSDSANAADLSVDIDGDITLDSVTGNIIGKANGGTYTPSADNHLATKKYVDDNIPDEIVNNGQTFVWKHVHVTADASDCESMHTTPKQLIAAQGSGTTIVLGPGYLYVDKNTSQTQNNAAADLNFHFADLEPGVFGQTSLFHLRRFMVSDNADRVYLISAFPAVEAGQSLTEGTDKAIEASFEDAITPNSITKVEFYLSYYVLTL